MDEPVWSVLKRVVVEALELPAEARQSWIDDQCSDPGLRAEATRLLLSCELAASSPVFDRPAVWFAEPLLAGVGERTHDRDPLHLVGRAVSHFRVIELLARGGMGVVYRAEDSRLRRPIALKFPLVVGSIDPAAMERFHQEARAAAALDHPNLCPVYEIGETSDGDLFYAMPLYEGETLKARLAREGRLPLDEALRIAVQLAQGLGAAHCAEIVHRDLKPANVMLLPDGTAKILDFGLARASDVSLTLSWARLGTIAYMAPEQVRGDEVDRRADLWALGVVLHEMVIGRRPFGGGHEIGVAHAILHEQPPTPSAFRDEIPPELDHVIGACLRKDPAERPRSAEELATSLREITLDSSSRAPWGFRRARLGIKPRVQIRTPMVLAATLLAVAAGAVLAGRLTTEAAAPVSLAVLPFGWVGDSAGTHHLAVGLGDGVGTDLARLRGVIVPSYVTTSIYHDSAVPPKRIAGELQVEALLRGRVQRVDERVRVDVQLVDGNGTRLWDRRYERPVSELAQLQRVIARGTVATLGIRLSEDERKVLDSPAAADEGAYDVYLRGRGVELAGQSRDFLHTFPEDNIRRAMSLYSQARDIDPRFAQARARLALMHALAAATYDATEARREQARVEAEAALRLGPPLPEAYEALAYSWALEGDPTRAIEQLERGLEAFPHSADLRLRFGSMLARAGRLDEAVAEFDKAIQLEPGSPKPAFAAGLFYSRLRRRDVAMQRFDRAIALAPDHHMVKVIKGQAYLRWKGIPDTLAAATDGIPADWDPRGMATYARYTALWAQRRYADALAMLDRSGSELSRDGLVYQPTSLMRARLHEALGHRGLARASYEEARAVLQDSVAAHPTDPSVRIPLALAYAGLGRTSEAVSEARRAMELAPIASGTGEATAFMGGAVEVFARAGETDAALDLLELLFSMPAGREVTVPFLRVWPAFDPLRSDPRFEELLVRFDSAR